MKKITIFSSLLLLKIGALFSQTIISGGQVSGLWTKANSPYIINGAIMIANGSNLTIEPGVKVDFQGSFKFLMLGSLQAKGTVNDTIIFTATNHTTGWLGFRFDNTSVTNDSSRFAYCRLEYGNVNAATYPDNEGGIFKIINFPKVRISNSVISNCQGFNGGVMSCRGGGAKLYNNVFANNKGTSCGVIESSNNTSMIISNNLFINNISNGSSYSYGGAIGTWDAAVIVNNTFSNNISLAGDYSGGAIYCGSNCSADIGGNKFVNNASPNCCGGAIYCYSGMPKIYNNLIANNSSLNGGAIYCESDGNFFNNTIANNSASKGAAMFFKSSSPTISNCIMWGNTASAVAGQIYIDDENCDPNFYYNDIQGGATGLVTNSNVFYLGNFSNNINADPQFINPSVGTSTLTNALAFNWFISSTSPCVNAGNPNGTYPSFDLSNNPRIVNGIIDIGAYEYSITNGINENIKNEEVNIYPNPSAGKFTFSNIKAGNSIEVFDLSGKLIFETTAAEDTVTIDIKGTNKGVYGYRVMNTEGKARQGKLIVK